MAKAYYSYVARYWSTDGKTLIGGITESQTSRMQSYFAAAERLSQIKEMNGTHCQGEIVTVRKYPELFQHTEEIETPDGFTSWRECRIGITCIGATCSCGKKLTVADAKASADNVPLIHH